MVVVGSEEEGMVVEALAAEVMAAAVTAVVVMEAVEMAEVEMAAEGWEQAVTAQRAKEVAEMVFLPAQSL